MLRISKQVDYGILLLAHCSSGPRSAIHSTRDLAAESGLPVPMVSKILKGLTREGLLESQRGVKGGYRLARPAHEINVRQLIEALEGPLGITECAPDGGGDCEHESHCPVAGNWQRINLAIGRALEGISLADMTRPAPGASPEGASIESACGTISDLGPGPLSV